MKSNKLEIFPMKSNKFVIILSYYNRLSNQCVSNITYNYSMESIRPGIFVFIFVFISIQIHFFCLLLYMFGYFSEKSKVFAFEFISKVLTIHEYFNEYI